MKGLTFRGIEAVGYETLPDPELQAPGDAILRVVATAVCGSDLHVYHGRERGLDVGTVLGHEFVGEVVAAGPDARLHPLGSRVVSPFSTSCGACFYCARGLTARCAAGELFGWVADGRGLHGGQAELVRVPLADSTLVAAPPAVGDDEVLFAGDILATGMFAADLAAVGPGDVVAIVGCGPVGLMAMVAARELGAARVLAFDRVPERLLLASRFGADAGFNIDEPDHLEPIRTATAGRGADAVLEVVGSPAATRLAASMVRPGGTIAAVGVHTEEHLAFSPGFAYDTNLTYRAGRCPARHYMGRALSLLATGRYPFAAIISHRLPLAEGPAAYALFAARRDGCTKVVLRP